jgi:predicted nucleic acid-binding protein
MPAGTQVFIDTNIFVYHFYGKSVTCTAFMGRIASGEVIAYVNTQVLSDLLHKMMIAEAARKGYCRYGAKYLKQWLAANRNTTGTLTDYQTEFENTLALGLNVLDISKKVLVDTKQERATYGLMTGDSLHLGNMNRHKPILQDIATYDGDFEHIAGVNVWKPVDVVP